MSKVVVLDRDGTIVVDRHYLADPSALEFEPGAEAGLRRMSDMGCRLVVITRQASEELGFDMSESIVIGDRDSDVEFGRRAGAVTILIGKPEVQLSSSATPAYVVQNLKEAADIISRQDPQSRRP
jgi:histidinol phosphatase-like enzyme